MNLQERCAVDEVIGMIEGDVCRATKFLSPTTIVRAVRKVYRGKFSAGNMEIILTVGKPNYQEREFIKVCKEKKCLFPVDEVRIKRLPVKKKLKTVKKKK